MSSFATLVLVMLSLGAGNTPPAETHAGQVERRGDEAMTLSHAMATHHFRLTGDGGVIQVTANDPSDTATRDHIRAHLRLITARFADGDFSMPMFIHGRVPPGTATMKRLRKAIHYRFVPLPAGGEVRISTADHDALKAVHAFLRFQIRDHHTGDPLTVGR